MGSGTAFRDYLRHSSCAFSLFEHGAIRVALAASGSLRRDIPRQRPDHFDAGLGDDLAYEGQADIDVTEGSRLLLERAPPTA
jgi:hypothetical protein